MITRNGRGKLTQKLGQLNRPHAYQAASYLDEVGSEARNRLRLTNILLSLLRISDDLAHLREHVARANGHHNGHHQFEPQIS